MSLNRSRCASALAAGTLSIALLSAGSAGAFAANSTPTPMPTRTHSAPPATMGSITLKANHTAVKVGNTVVLSGTVRGLKTGSTLVLQRMTNGKWANLKTTAVVGKNGTFAIKRTLTTKGSQTLRVAAGNLHSRSITVRAS
ncbi:hypothetical protein RKE30_33855 [Streptomyces sp. Li-HN-5-11]|uniref:hypothetical protein n=1 Tax=Streptomyces sp. Li-HN-5-11 TaxID=3075432 RepID=UPI0028AF25C5|nr:hypothetical protein [Streptomyces sp. Li-HN-5-11]WNM35004.1 hypothetical protein RKE30_33855 [Streptomyces sp. Li-HN-5-11]